MDLNTILIILGVIALVALVAHGIWSSRREKSQIFENKHTFTKDYRTRRSQENINSTTQSEPVTSKIPQGTESIQSTQQYFDFDSEQQVLKEEPQNVEQAVSQIKISIPNGAFSCETVEQNRSHQSLENLTSVTISEIEKMASPDDGIHIEHKLSDVLSSNVSTENTIYIERERSNVEFEEMNHFEVEDKKETLQEQDNNFIQDFLMLYIVSPEHKEFNGADLAKVFDDLGFIFGHQQIYHRHLDLSATSPVLFSAANIQQPGIFDPNNMADFYTVGIALFMQLPSHGNDLANLRMMIRAAKTIAEELGGFVLTDEQEIFDDNAEQAYYAKVRN